MLLWLWMSCVPVSDSGTGNGVLAECYSYCGVAAQGEKCDEPAVRAACEDECQVNLLGLSSSCQQTYEELLVCLSGVEWVCDGSVEEDGLVWPVPATEECDSLEDDLLDCLS